MAGVVCFGLIVPQALRRHDSNAAYAIALLFVAYAAVNLILWRRYQR